MIRKFVSWWIQHAGDHCCLWLIFFLRKNFLWNTLLKKLCDDIIFLLSLTFNQFSAWTTKYFSFSFAVVSQFVRPFWIFSALSISVLPLGLSISSLFASAYQDRPFHFLGKIEVHALTTIPVCFLWSFAFILDYLELHPNFEFSYGIKSFINFSTSMFEALLFSLIFSRLLSLTLSQICDKFLHWFHQNAKLCADCSDITNNRFGISGETVPEGRNLPIFFCYVQSHHLVSGGSNIWVTCITPHSSPTRGCWYQQ